MKLFRAFFQRTGPFLRSLPVLKNLITILIHLQGQAGYIRDRSTEAKKDPVPRIIVQQMSVNER